MKRLITLMTFVTVLLAGIGPALAAVDPPKVPPKGIEGPNIRAKVAPKGLEGPDIRAKLDPKGVEGPDTR